MGRITLKIGKVKSTSQLSLAYDHNLRMNFCENADPARRGLNRNLIGTGMSYSQFFQARLDASPRFGGSRPKRTPRSNAVRALDICVAVNSREPKENAFFNVDKFCELTKQWAIKHFGEENLAGMVFHADEGAPHVHIVVVPMTSDGRLSAFEYTGTREKLIALQDSIAEALSPLHLERGIRKSVAKPHSMKAFYGALAEAQKDTLPAPLEGESAEQYAIRANAVSNMAKMQWLAKEREMQRQIDDAKSIVRQYESGDFALEMQKKIRLLEAENKKLKAEKLSEEESRNAAEKALANAKEEAKKTAVTLREWSAIATVVDKHLLPKEREDALIHGMYEALMTYRQVLGDEQKSIEQGTKTDEMQA